MRDILLTLSALFLMLCLVGCISVPSTNGEDSTAQTEEQTQAITQFVTETAEQSSAPVTDTPTDTAEEQTTFGELHFPESGE